MPREDQQRAPRLGEQPSPAGHQSGRCAEGGRWLPPADPGQQHLYPALLAAGLIDGLTTLTSPIALGHGKRLFGAGTPAGAFMLVDHTVSPAGVVIVSYEPAGSVAIKRFGRDGSREE